MKTICMHIKWAGLDDLLHMQKWVGQTFEIVTNNI